MWRTRRTLLTRFSINAYNSSPSGKLIEVWTRNYQIKNISKSVAGEFKILTFASSIRMKPFQLHVCWMVFPWSLFVLFEMQVIAWSGDTPTKISPFKKLGTKLFEISLNWIVQGFQVPLGLEFDQMIPWNCCEYSMNDSLPLQVDKSISWKFNDVRPFIFLEGLWSLHGFSHMLLLPSVTGQLWTLEIFHFFLSSSAVILYTCCMIR